jgi:para-nitrobenzyl esterase
MDFSRRTFLGSSATAAAATVLGGAVPAAHAAAATVPAWTRRPVRTQSGMVAGGQALLPGVAVYKGIPYGAPTGGANRWRPPRPAPRWDGVREATSWGAACVQDTSGISAGLLPPISEDCLNLNVWTAAEAPDQGLPVLVWAYGGRDSAMWASQPLYDGSGLARKGLIVVTFNRRIGPFGCLATPQLTAESGRDASGNYVLMDVIAALEWVRENIRAFGGDPGRVTLGGWSAGAACTWDLVCSPLASGLFHRALAESGLEYTKDPALSHLAGSYITLSEAEAQGTALMKTLGVASLEELRGLPAGTIQDAGSSIGSYILDGWVLRETYTQTLAAGAQNDVPFMTGNNKDENDGFMSSSTKPGATLTLAEYESAAKTEFGSLASDFLALYPANTDAGANDLNDLASEDDERISSYLWGTQWVAGGRAPAYTYFWTHTPPGEDTTNPVVPTATTGAYHGSEIYYIFGNLYGTGRPWTAADYRIAETLSDYVVNFAAAGDPNGPGLARWRALTPGRPEVMEVGDSFGTIDAASSQARYEFFANYFESQTTEW